jgi:hypothetical protein
MRRHYLHYTASESTSNTMLIRSFVGIAARKLYKSCGFTLVWEALGSKWGKEMMIQQVSPQSDIPCLKSMPGLWQ